jgi:hypothetical protein
MQAAYSTIAADSAGVGDGALERWSIWFCLCCQSQARIFSCVVSVARYLRVATIAIGR